MTNLGISRPLKLPPMPTALDWMVDASCRHPSANPDWWWPIGNGHTKTPDEARAQAICRTCPVLAECAALAQHSAQTAGIWAGLNLAQFDTNPARETSLRHIATTARKESTNAQV